MPPVVGYLGLIAAQVGFGTIVSVTMFAVNAYKALTAKKPQAGVPASRETGWKSMLQDPVAFRTMVYGERQTSGPLVYASSSGTNNEYLHMIVILASHEVEGIDDVYFNDIAATEYDTHGRPQISSHYFIWTNPGVWEINITDSSGTRSYSNGSKGGLVSDINAGEAYITAANHPSINRIDLTATLNDYSFTSENRKGGAGGFNAERVIQQSFSPYRIKKHLGSSTQVADSDLVAESPDGEWTTAHRLQGLAYVYVRLKWDESVWKNGMPNVSAVVRGRNDIYDPRTLTTGYTDNSALCVRSYLLDADGGGFAESELDDTLFINAANACDELVDLKDGTTQKRYTTNGIISTGDTMISILEKLLAAMVGNINFTQGAWKIYAGAYELPTSTITADDLRGDMSIKFGTDRRDIFNAVKGTYVDAAQNYQPTDFPPVTNSYYESQDNGERIYQDIELSFVTDATRAQRIAKIYLEKIRQGITVELPLKLTKLELVPGQTVVLNIEHLGWTGLRATESGNQRITESGNRRITEEGGKVFRVSSCTISRTGGIDVVLTEEAAGIYNWNKGEPTLYDLAPNTNLPSPFVLAPPSSISIASGDNELLVGTDGTVTTRMLVNWTPPGDAYIVGYDVGYKKTTEADWTTFATIQTEAYINGVEDGEEYDIKVRGKNAVGILSPYIETTHTVIGKSELPPDVDSFFVRAQGDGTREFSWSLDSPPKDHGGYRIKYKAGSGGTWATMTDLHSGLLAASPFESNQLAAGAYTFGIKAVDTSGNESANEKIIELTLPDPRIVGALDFLDLRVLGWPGTKTNCWVSSDGDLHAKDQKTWADFAIDVVDWANWTTWARNPYTTISYEHTVIDIGVKTKFIPLVSVTTDAATITVEEAHSDDDITYTSFAALTGSEIEARYIKIKVSITDVVNNPATVENVSIILSAKVLTEDTEDLDISTLTGANRIGTGHVKIPLQGAFTIVRRVDVVLQNVGAGWTWELISKADLTNGPEIKVYNGAGALADATIDATIRGL